MDLFTPPLNPDVGMPRRVRHSVREAQFGEGYSQRSTVLNSKGQQLDLSWGLLEPSQADVIEAFFDDLQGAEAFLYAPPNAAFAPVPWIAQEYERQDYGMFCSFTATLKRVFDLGEWSGGTGGGITVAAIPIRMTAAQFAAANPVLADGVMGIEVDTNFLKVGDGVLSWNNLDYITSPSSVSGGAASFEQRTAAAWIALNPVLGPQAMGYEIDTQFAKLGDGANRWSELPYLQMPLTTSPLRRLDAGDQVLRTTTDAVDGGDVADRGLPSRIEDAGDSADRGL